MHARDPIERHMALVERSLLDAHLFTVLCALNLRSCDGMTELGPAAGEGSGSFSLKPSPPVVETPMPIKPVTRPRF
jgi:hypothetical protein